VVPYTTRARKGTRSWTDACAAAHSRVHASRAAADHCTSDHCTYWSTERRHLCILCCRRCSVTSSIPRQERCRCEQRRS
jgi:hypothetical protein